MPVPLVTVQCDANPVPFYDADQSGQPAVMGQTPYAAATIRPTYDTSVSFTGQIQDWQCALPYNQKFMMGDTVTVQLHTQHDPSVGIDIDTLLYLCDHTGAPIAGIDLNVAPYYKGRQIIPGNNFYQSGATVPLKSYTWMFDLTSLLITDGGIYYLKVVNEQNIDGGGSETQILYSEPLLFSNQEFETRDFTYQYNASRANIYLIVGDWYDDFPTNTIPTQLYFTLRIEAYRTKLGTKALLIGYKQQSYNPISINTMLKRAWTLSIGEVSLGLPEYLIEKAGYAITSDDWEFDGYGYSLPFDGSNASLTDLWKIQEADVNPLRIASTAIMEKSDGQRAIVHVRPTTPDRIFTGVFSAEFM